MQCNDEGACLPPNSAAKNLIRTLIRLQRLSAQELEDVVGDDGSVLRGFEDLLLFLPVDDIARCEDVGVLGQLEGGFDFDEAGGGEGVGT